VPARAAAHVSCCLLPAILLLLLLLQIMEIASFEKFLTDKIKVGNKTGEQAAPRAADSTTFCMQPPNRMLVLLPASVIVACGGAVLLPSAVSGGVAKQGQPGKEGSRQRGSS
jgi:hypothetical protein